MTRDRTRQLRWTRAGTLLALVVLVGGCAAARAHAGKAQPSQSRSTHAAATRAARPLSGPAVLDAQVFAGGRGYVRTDDALFWTDNSGKTWRSITPPGVRAAQLQSASVVVHSDGSAWVALTPRPGNTTVTLLRRSAAGFWRRTDVAIAPLTITSYSAGSVRLSFPTARDGWMLVAQVPSMNTFVGEFLRTTDRGAAWAVQSGPQSRPGAGEIDFVTPQVGFLDAAPAEQWWVSRDAGRAWAPLKLPVPEGKRADTATLSAPTLAGNAINIPATYTTPVQGAPAGLVLYRSTDLGRTWTAEQPTGVPTAEQYEFATTPDGTRAVLLSAQHSADFTTYTWATSLSSDEGAHFSTTTSRHAFYPESATIAGTDTLWAIVGANGCTGFKTGCWQQSGLVASTDGGRSWHQVAVPS